jgi:trans-aconitate 2-methyltransferase
LAGTSAIVEWFKSTGLKPYIAPLSDAARTEFLDRYQHVVSRSYPVYNDGAVLLPFPRIFIVARRLT